MQCTVGAAGEEAPLGAPLFACHKTAEGKEQACAGWLAVCGYDHLTVRLAMATGGLPKEAILPPDSWPELYESYEEMAKEMGRDT